MPFPIPLPAEVPAEEIAQQVGNDFQEIAEVVARDGFGALWDQFAGAFLDYFPTLLMGLITAVVGLVLIKVILAFVTRGLARSKVEKALHTFVISLTRILLLGLLLVSCLGILGLPLTPIITALSAAGLALSLALKDSLSNLAGGVFLLFNRPFRAGDYIELKGIAGTVQEIRLTYTVLRTSFNRSIFLPNGDFAKATVTNYSTDPTRCMELTFLVKPESGNVDAAKAVILEALRESGLALPEPAPSLRVSDQTDSALKLTCMAWVEPQKLFDLKAFVLQRVREEFVRQEIQ